MTLAEKITTVNLDAPAPITVKGSTTESVLRAIAARDGKATDPIITELIARYDAKAAKRARMAILNEE
jgi:hypothetical protein